jgi:carboxyl-terminal processing protease
MMYELYDHHASLSTNTQESQRLVPSGTDVWAEYKNGKPIITEVRKDFGAYKAGLAEGAELISVNDIPVEAAIRKFLPLSLKKPSIEAKNYALRLLLAGKHSEQRKLVVKQDGTTKVLYPDKPVNMLKDFQYPGILETKTYDKTGYIKINNRLWDNNLIDAFDSALNQLLNTKALILDLRETPSGGNTTVARAIMGRFISKDGYYQKHELTAEEEQYGVKRSWIEIVSPRGVQYTKPLIVLCNHWTGSVGEGITIGFDALKRATIIGTKMAGLNGAIYSYTMPNTGIGFSIPVEKLFHVNGTPRENFYPGIIVSKPRGNTGEDVILSTAIKHF